MNGFFAPYAYLSIIALTIAVIFVFILAWLSVKAFKNKWAFPIVILIISFLCYFTDEAFLASIFGIFFVIASVVITLYSMFMKNKKFNQKK